MQTVVLIGLAAVLGAPGPKDDPKKDAPSLVGEWVPTMALRGGKPDIPPAGTSITFTADGKVLLKEGNKGKAEEGTYKADPKKDPAEVDIIPPDNDKGAPVIGIYKLEKDTLVICVIMGTERPKKFESPEGSEIMLITLQRAKKE
jgi:uncharacterized protein (TIGR03067 family)